ncbi:hypothetical protein D3C71_1391700 [compost metagenome]
MVQLRPGRQHLDQRPDRSTDHLQRRHDRLGRLDGWHEAGHQELDGLAGLQRRLGSQRRAGAVLRYAQLHRRVAAGRPLRLGRRARRGRVRARHHHRGLQRRPADHPHGPAAGRRAGLRCAGHRLGLPEQLQQVQGRAVPGPRYVQIRRLLGVGFRRRLHPGGKPLGLGDHAAQQLGWPGQSGGLR